MRKVVWIIVFLLGTLMVNAQHYFSAGLRGGVATWDALTNYVSPRPNLHAGLELAYAYRSPYVIGFRIGAVIDHHHTLFGKKNYEDSYTTIDVEDAFMQIDYTIGNLREHYLFWSVGIPIQLSFSWRNVSLALGPKFVFPLSATWRETAEDAALSVYYPKYENRVYESVPLAASRNFAESCKGSLDLPTIQYWISSELTYDIPLPQYSQDRISYITIGVYFDYTLSDMTVTRSNRISLLMLSDTHDGFPLIRELDPILTATRQSKKLVTRATLFDLGIKVAYTLSPYNPRRKAARSCHCW